MTPDSGQNSREYKRPAVPHALRDALVSCSPVLIAASGGLDSRTLTAAALAVLGPDSVEIVHFTGPHMTPDEREAAQAWLRATGTTVHVIEASPLDVAEVAGNPEDRCYHCKLLLFSRAAELARASGQALVDGSNESDLGEYRPGRRALAELGVRSPLAEAGLAKDQVRELARALDIVQPDQPARACLLTRLPYGMRVDAELLARLGRAEDALMRLGLQEFRIRLSDGGPVALHLAHVEQGRWEQVRNRALAALREEGFQVSDAEFVEKLSGYFDRTLK